MIYLTVLHVSERMTLYIQIKTKTKTNNLQNTSHTVKLRWHTRYYLFIFYISCSSGIYELKMLIYILRFIIIYISILKKALLVFILMYDVLLLHLKPRFVWIMLCSHNVIMIMSYVKSTRINRKKLLSYFTTRYFRKIRLHI